MILLRRLTQLEVVLGCFGLALMVFALIGQLVGRYVLPGAASGAGVVDGATEVALLGLLLSVVCSLRVACEYRHFGVVRAVRIPALPQRRWLSSVVYAICALFFLVLFFLSVFVVAESRALGDLTHGLRWPVWLLQSVVVAGFLFNSLRFSVYAADPSEHPAAGDAHALLPAPVLVGISVLLLNALFEHGHPEYVVYDLWQALRDQDLLAIPGFLLAGTIIANGASGPRLIDLLLGLTRHFVGGAAIAVLLTAAGFTALTGSSAIMLLVIGRLLFDVLRVAGTDKRVAIGLICGGGVVGTLLPASMPLLVFAVLTDSNAGAVFAAALGPAALLFGALVLYAKISHLDELPSGSRFEPISPNAPNAANATVAALRAAMPLAMVAVIAVVLYAGWFRVAEASALAVVFAILVESVSGVESNYKGGLGRKIFATSRKALDSTGRLLPLLALAVAVDVFVTYQEIPGWTAGFVAQTDTSSHALLAIGTGVSVLIGMFVDTAAAVAIVGPFAESLAVHLAMNPLQSGVLLVLCLTAGSLIPPFGIHLIVALAVFGEDMQTLTRAILPVLAILLLLLALVAFFPSASVFFASSITQ